MSSHRFTYRPGVTAPAGAEALALANIRPVTQPAGPIRTFLESLDDWENDYTTAQMFMISQTFLDLMDAGIIGPDGIYDRLWLPLPGNSGADSLVDWCGNGPMSNHGGTINANGTISLDGTDDYLGSGLTPSGGGLKYTLNQASFFLNIFDDTGLVNNDYAVGHFATGVSADQTLAPLTGSGANATTRVNCVAEAVVGAYSGPRTGTWIANRVGSPIVRLVRNGIALAVDETNPADTLAASEICVAKHSSNYAQFVWGGFGMGGKLTVGQEAALTTIVATHHAMLVAA